MNSNHKILIGGILSLVVSLGVARFAFTSLLPAMLDNFLTVKQAGILAAINYVGYLSGALLVIFTQNVNTKIKLFRAGLAICIAATLVLAWSQDLWLWQISRVIAGFGSALVLVVGSSVVMLRLRMANRRVAMGIHFSGIGVAILSCDLLVKACLGMNLSWSQTWLALSIFALLLSVFPLFLLPQQARSKSVIKQTVARHQLFTPFIVLLIFAYFAEGVGFVVQATFLPDIINQTVPGFGSLTWLLVGVSGVGSCLLLMTLAKHFGSINMIIVALLLQIVGILIPTLSNNLYLNLISGILYGGTFVGLVALFMHLGGRNSGGNPVILMGILTTGYGIGQITAPLYSVKMVETSGNYNNALYLTAVIVFLGMLCMLFSKRLEHQ